MKMRNLFIPFVVGMGMWIGLPGLAGGTAMTPFPFQKIEIPPESPAHAEFRKGIAALVKGELKTADQAFRAAAKMDPKLAAPLLGLADVALKQGHASDAKKWLAQASRVEPSSDQTQIGWARYHRSRKNYAEAERALQKAIELKPTAAAYLELGDIHLTNLDQRRAALEAYEKAAALAPDSAVARYSLASGLAANGQVARALQEFERVAQMLPNDPEPWRSMGRLYTEQHRFDEAISAFEHGLKLQPKHVPLLVDRGDVAAAQGKWGDAVRYYREATKHAPDSSPLLIKLGMANYLSQQWSDAEAAYLKAVQLDPKAADAYNNLAWLMVERRLRLNEAVKWAEKATQLAPGEASYFDTLGWGYRALGNLDKAAETLRKAAGMKLAKAEVHYHLGIVYTDQGKRSEAVSALKRALEVDPGFPQAADAHKRLKALK